MPETSDSSRSVEGKNAFQSIVPQQPDLSRHKRVRAPQSLRTWLRRLFRFLALFGVTALSITVLWAIRKPDAIRPDAFDPATTPAQGVVTTERVQPFRDVLLERARERARELLREFTTLQSILDETYNNGAWDPERYDAIVAVASDGDVHFANREFEEALEQYASATNSLRAFINEGKKTVANQSNIAANALNARNEEEARRALEIVELIQPGRRQTDVRLKRLAVLPEVRRLHREARRAQIQDDYDRSLELLLQVRDLDPLTDDIDLSIEEVHAKIEEKRLQELMSRGFMALHNQNYDTAESEFSKLLQDYPDHETALAGLEETRQRRTSDRIATLRGQAESTEKSDQPVKAMALYQEALRIDSSLQFAREGVARLKKIRNAYVEADRIIQDPHVLSSELEIEAARQALAELQKHREFSQGSSQRADKLAELIEYSKQQFRLVLISDSTTEVILAKVRPLGKFERVELTLRPGRYLLLGSRDGYRDVRKHVVVEPNSQPVVIQCEEPI